MENSEANKYFDKVEMTLELGELRVVEDSIREERSKLWLKGHSTGTHDSILKKIKKVIEGGH